MPNGTFNRAHVAEAMMKKGYITSIAEGFETVLSKSAGHYKEPKRLRAEEIIDYIDSIGAVSVLAHPFLNLSEHELIEFLKGCNSLCGMECYYSTYDEETMLSSIKIAEEFDLLCSGGSDFHGSRKPDIKLGVGKGNLSIPYEWYLALREKSR